MSWAAVRPGSAGGGLTGIRPSRLRRVGVPVASVLLASLVPAILPQIAVTPWLPPLGFMMLVAWRLLRPELFPIWVGLPFGLFDDAFSGQPVGTAACLWALSLLAIDHIDRRLIWRGFWHDWGIVAILLPLVILAGAALSQPSIALGKLAAITGPQMAASVLFYPVMVRIAAFADRLRLRAGRRVRA